ncbi:hypothetical protein TWF694_008434 [Orbilia ellipsospora]|uniref:CHAT domain-containing protein n=1 Tax=Orbilia ellipsospora TaxID=2528407 RepID=A0AAV9XHL1_9PEZI
MDSEISIPFLIDSDILQLVKQLDLSELKDFADLHKEPLNDIQIELYTYLCYEVYKRSGEVNYLVIAAQQAQAWWELTRDDDLTRREGIMKALNSKMMTPIKYIEYLNLEEAFECATTFSNLRQSNLASFNDYTNRFFQNKEFRIDQMELINRTYEQVINSRNLSVSNQIIILYALGINNYIKYRVTGSTSIQYISKSVEYLDRAVGVMGPKYYARSLVLQELTNSLRARAKHTRSIKDLDRALDICESVIDITIEDNIELAMVGELWRWIKLAFIRVEANVEGWDLTASKPRPGLMKPEPELSRRALHSYEAVIDLILRKCNDSIETGDYQSAVNFHKSGARFVMLQSPAPFPLKLDTLLRRHCLEALNISKLTRAIEAFTTVERCTVNLHHRHEILWALSNLLVLRFFQTGEEEDIRQGASLAGEALELSLSVFKKLPDDERLLFAITALYKNHQKTKTRETLKVFDDAMEKIMTSEATHGDDADPNVLVHIWAELHIHRYYLTESEENFIAAVEILTALVENSQVDRYSDPEKGIKVAMLDKMNLGFLYLQRYNQTDHPSDLEQAIESIGTSVNSGYLLEHPNFSGARMGTAFALFQRAEVSGSLNDIKECTKMLEEEWTKPTHFPRFRASIGNMLADCYATQEQWSKACQVIEECVKLLFVMAPRSHHNSTKQQHLKEFFGLGSRAAYLFLCSGKEPSEALNILELGRGVMIGLMLEIRTDTSQLKEEYPDLADKYTSLRDLLETPVSQDYVGVLEGDLLPRETGRKTRRDAEKELAGVLTDIQSKPGFERFLLPHTTKQIMRAAEKTPIAVINVNKNGCHALLVEGDRIRALELPNLKKTEIPKNVTLKQGDEAEIWEVLEWLWDAVTKPVLDALGYTSKPTGPISTWPRICWIPTLELSQLPLHAAGKHLDDCDDSVMDRVISSYSLSIKSLIYGRERIIPDIKDSHNALVVSMQQTPGHSSLHFAEEEVKIVEDMCLSLDLTCVRPKKQGDEILSNMETCRVFHFAGHGSFNISDPSQSCLLLDDWETSPLTVAKLWDHNLKANPPFLAFLSACSTGANDEVALSDEGINLIGAYQLAGFRHVIGTLWEVDDLYCVKIAKEFYTTVQAEGGLQDDAIGVALHTALRHLRHKSVENSSLRSLGGEGRDGRNAKTVRSRGNLNFHWVPYVHFGV